MLRSSIARWLVCSCRRRCIRLTAAGLSVTVGVGLAAAATEARRAIGIEAWRTRWVLVIEPKSVKSSLAAELVSVLITAIKYCWPGCTTMFVAITGVPRNVVSCPTPSDVFPAGGKTMNLTVRLAGLDALDALTGIVALYVPCVSEPVVAVSEIVAGALVVERLAFSQPLAPPPV